MERCEPTEPDVEGGAVIACPQCDLLQLEVPLAAGSAARCGRCAAILYRNPRNSIDRTLACLLAAAILLVIANLYPMMGLEAEGIRTDTTLIGGVRAMWRQQMHLVAVMVVATTIVAPAVEIGVMLYLLLPVRFSRTPPGSTLILRILQEVRPWEMVEVFMLGLLVSLVRLGALAAVLPGIALWAFAGLTFLLAAAAASFNPREVWARLERNREGQAWV